MVVRWWAARLAVVNGGVVSVEDGDRFGVMILVILLLLDDMLALSWRKVCSDTYV
jgi:hypothetical protein